MDLVHWDDLEGASGEGGGKGVGMGNTCKPMAVSFQCMTKFTTNKKIKNKIKRLKKKKTSGMLKLIKRSSLGKVQNDILIMETKRDCSCRLIKKLVTLLSILHPFYFESKFDILIDQIVIDDLLKTC